MRIAGNTQVVNAPSGFRSMPRSAAIRLNVFNAYTWTLEAIIQAGLSNLRVMEVPLRTNCELHPSRLVKSISNYVRRSLVTMLRVVIVYRPLLVWTGAMIVGHPPSDGLRFIYYYLGGNGDGHIQSLILASLCIFLGTVMWMMDIISELISSNSELLETINRRIQRLRDKENS